MSGFADGLDRPLGEVVFNDQLDFNLGQKVDDIFGPAIKFGMTFLAAEALRLDDSQTLQADFV